MGSRGGVLRSPQQHCRNVIGAALRARRGNQLAALGLERIMGGECLLNLLLAGDAMQAVGAQQELHSRRGLHLVVMDA
jgi:hypothetical protein